MRSISWQTAGHDNSLLRRRVVFALIAIVIQLAKVSWGQAVPQEPEDCNPPAIDEFPEDFFTQEQRRNGGVIIHIIIATYLIFSLGAICDDYFVPVLEILCEKLHLSSDVAGATFMAAGTSAPELFTNIMGTFVTKSDLGIGTIVGSAVFNIFGVVAVCGLFAGIKIPLDWYPVTRDCIVYGFAVMILFIVLIDEHVLWWEALIMIVAYFGYIALMAVNSRIERWALGAMKTIKKRVYPSMGGTESSSGGISLKPNESTPLHMASKATQATVESAISPVASVSASTQTICREDSVDAPDPKAAPNGHMDVAEDEDVDDPGYPWDPPDGVLAKIWWLCFFPLNLLYFFTIPDVRRAKCVNFYPLAFVMCMVWIGVIAYEVTWLITVIGYTISVPDTVMGLSFLAVGTSIPEVFSSLIVARQGKGSMAISNSIGSNTFDILVCLGVPWMIKALMTGFQDGKWFVEVQSKSLIFTVISLLISLVVLYAILLASRFILSRTMGVVSLLIYLSFLTVALLFELNVFYDVNLPTCKSEEG